MVFKKLKQIKKQREYEKFFVSPEIINTFYSNCKARKVNPELTEIPRLFNHIDANSLMKSSKYLLSAAWPVIKNDLYPSFVNEDQLIIFCNHEGYAILFIFYNSTVHHLKKYSGPK